MKDVELIIFVIVFCFKYFISDNVSLAHLGQAGDDNAALSRA